MLLTSCTPAEMVEWLQPLPAFRAKQLYKALYAGAQTFDDITTFSKDLRQNLAAKAPLFSSRVVTVLKEEGNAKIVVELYDGAHVESVLLRDKSGRQTACLSCQVGCGMGCAFCKTGTLGFSRNLEAGEIIEQFLHLQHQFGPLDNVVYMGMGEPLANLDEVLKSIDLFNNAEGLHMSTRRFTISTCGLVDGIKELARKKSEVRLAFSLVTADQQLREKIMPTAKANSLINLKDALLYYQNRGGRRVTLEAALLPGYNNRPEDAEYMANFAQDLDCMVNLIPWNKVEGLPFRSPTEKEVTTFMELLEGFGLTVERRYKKGSGIGGACGQLGQSSKPDKSS